jgi:hypothetical protein
MEDDLRKHSTPGRTHIYPSDIMVNFSDASLYYLNALTKCVELIIINKFGKRNVPYFWWRLKNSAPKIYSYQKKLFPMCGKLLKLYKPIVVMECIRRNKIQWIGYKNIGLIQFKCREIEIELNKTSRKADKIDDAIQLCEPTQESFETNKRKNVLEWLDGEKKEESS